MEKHLDVHLMLLLVWNLLHEKYEIQIVPKSDADTVTVLIATMYGGNSEPKPIAHAPKSPIFQN
jgi:hypothetical protein